MDKRTVSLFGKGATMRADREWNGWFRFFVVLLWLMPAILLLTTGVFTVYALFSYVLWSAILLAMLFLNPAVTISEEGVWVRRVLRKRLLPWDQIPQAGILCLFGRHGLSNELVLLNAGGSRRKYRDKTFLLRNVGRTIHLRAEKEVKNYVIQHYGPLDFDLTDKRCENSIVMDAEIHYDE